MGKRKTSPSFSECQYRKADSSARVPVLLVLVSLPFIPESPRWLIAKGREDDAHKMLAKYHANGDLQDELVLFELNEMKNIIAADAENDTTWKQAFGTPGNRKRFLMIACVSVFTSEC